ncbi:hypothetical protein BY458DRAFT_491320 [Sporodiniella umbellata]|nr:hypothetical protein BY458DRAFT_491320 [Sporodiniella umbellata]
MTSNYLIARSYFCFEKANCPIDYLPMENTSLSFSSPENSVHPYVDSSSHTCWNTLYPPFEAMSAPYQYVPRYTLSRPDLYALPPPDLVSNTAMFSPGSFDSLHHEKNYIASPHEYPERDAFSLVHRGSDSQSDTSAFEFKPAKKEVRKASVKRDRSIYDTKKKKRCSNCFSTSSPSWRRSILVDTKDQLLCNACGLYWLQTKKVPKSFEREMFGNIDVLSVKKMVILDGSQSTERSNVKNVSSVVLNAL